MIATFLHWWLEQIADLIPRGWRDGDKYIQDCLVVADTGDNACSGVIRRKDGVRALGHFACDNDGAQNLRSAISPDARPLAAVLLVPSAQILVKKISLPIAARRSVAQVLEFEIDHETPFRSDEVVWRYDIQNVDHAREKIDVELQLVPRQALADGTALIESAGLRLDAVEFTDGAGRRRHIPLQKVTARPSLTGQRVNVACAGLAASLAIAAAVIPFLRVEHALSSARADIERLRPVADQALTLKRELDELSKAARFTADERRRVRDPLQVMAAATSALPDGTYLTEFSLRSDQATLVGMSPAAANLISGLAAVAPFRDPTFGAAVVRPEGANLELFTIKARLDSTNVPAH